MGNNESRIVSKCIAFVLLRSPVGYTKGVWGVFCSNVAPLLDAFEVLSISLAFVSSRLVLPFDPIGLTC
jgi:hypothetical protein